MIEHFKNRATPSYLYDINELFTSVTALEKSINNYAKLLYSLKSCSLISVLRNIHLYVDGYSCSSLNEAKLAHSLKSDDQHIHFTTPAIKPHQASEINQIADHIVLNSVKQLYRYQKEFATSSKVGLRINPQISFIGEQKYDPCRVESKLGVPIDRLAKMTMEELPISGLQVHNNCDSENAYEFAQTVNKLKATIPHILRQIEWINLGGGYIIQDFDDPAPFVDSIKQLKEEFDLEVFIEPGAALVRSAGYLVSTVLDIIESDGAQVAILDTTVNHWPEVFEFQFEPDVQGHVDGGKFTYTLAGCSCLAGDIFGVYSFNEPIDIGSKIVFENAGAYSFVKAHMFNGIDLPDIYLLHESCELEQIQSFGYEDFARRCGVTEIQHNNNATD